MNMISQVILAAEGDPVFHPQTLVIIGMVIIIGVLFMARGRSKSKQVDARASLQARMHKDRLASQARDDIGELMLRLDELSREICGQIDTRFAKLEHALAEAEAKLAALNAAAGQLDAPAGGVAAPADPKHAEIYELARQGESMIEISRRMEMPVGEVELILSLERSRRGEPAEGETPPPHHGRTSRLDERA